MRIEVCIQISGLLTDKFYEKKFKKIRHLTKIEPSES